MASSTAKRKLKELPELIQKHQKTLARAKQLYQRADNLMAEIIEPYLETCEGCGHKHLKPDAVITLSADGKRAFLLDNFAENAIVWGHGGVRHFGIEIRKS
jgi:hypothetical protein